MSRQETHKDALETALRDHELVTQFITNGKRLLAGRDGPIDKNTLTEIKEFIRQQVLGHFAHEEALIFPMLLHGNPTPETFQLVGELRREHKELVKEAKQLMKELSASERDAPGGAALCRQFQRFAAHLEKHAARENELFPSLL